MARRGGKTGGGFLVACLLGAALTKAPPAASAEDLPPTPVEVTLGRELLDQGNAAGAVAQFDKALKAHPDNVEALIGRGDAYQALRRDSAALADYNRAVALSPDTPDDALLARADFFHARGRSADEERDLDRVLSFAPWNVRALIDRGVLRRLKGDIDGALADHRSALAQWVYRENAIAHWNLGLDLAKLGKYREAIEAYDRALAIQPNLIGPLLDRGDAHLELEDWDAAIADYGQVRKLDPRQRYAVFWQAWAWHEKGELQKALDGYSEAIRLAPQAATGYASRARVEIDLKRFEAARADATKAISLSPKFADAYAIRAQIVIGDAQGPEGDRALADLNKALSLDPDFVPALVRRSELYNRRGQSDAALRDATRAVGLAPDRFDARLELAIAKLDESPKLALADLDALVEKYPDDAGAWRWRGAAHVKLADFERSAQDYRRALELDRDYPGLRIDLAFALTNMGEMDAASAELTQAGEAAAGRVDPEPLLRRGTLYRIMGKPTEALADHDRVIALHPRFSEAYRERGEDYVALGMTDRALAAFNRALALAPNDTDALLDRADLYSDQDRLDLALADLNRAVRVRRNDPDIYLHRAHAHASRQDYAAAEADIDEAIRLAPDLAKPFVQRALLRVAQERLDLADAEIAKAMKVNPKDPLPLVVRGYLRAEADSYDLAIADLEAAIAAFPPMKRLAEAKIAEIRAAAAALRDRSLPGDGRRIALVLANDSYANLPALPNAAADAQDIAAALKGLGFEVYGYPKVGFTQAEMQAEIEHFQAAAANASAAVVWYAGHGQQFEVRGWSTENYLLPRDFRPNDEVATRAISLQSLLSAASPAKSLRVVVVDACRKTLRVPSHGAPPGMRQRGTAGMLVVYSTSANSAAQDGRGGVRNSPFAAAFLEAIRRGDANQDVRILFGAVAKRTSELALKSGSVQVPEQVNNILGSDTLTLAGK